MKKVQKETYNINLNTRNGLFFTKDNLWRNNLSFKTVQAIEKINPFAIFCFKNEPLILIFHNPTNLSKIHQLCWNFNKAPVIIFIKSKKTPITDNGNELLINSKDKIEIYNGFDLDEKNGVLNTLDVKIEEFNYWNIVSGRVWEQHASAFKNENKVDYKLLNNIGSARSKLLDSLKSDKATAIVNRVLGRLIFVRYLIDRDVKINFKQKAYLSKDDLTTIIFDKSELYDLFFHLQNVFNGDLFPFVGNTKEEIQNGRFEKQQLSTRSLSLISSLFRGDDINSGQTSLFHIYDFSIIPIELVSNIYEYFMGDEKQNKNKAFYTPPFLVDYLVNETVEPFLNSQDSWHCATLDPACGSGIFLVETLRRIIIKYKTLNLDIVENDIKRFKYHIVNILKDNIYGIDKDRDALDVAIFSLYITLLDFIEKPKDVEGFRFPYLLGSNFFEADFFESDFTENKENDFVEKLKRVRLDFILGNPPWGTDIKKEESPFLEYAAKRLKNEPNELKRLKGLFPFNKKGQKRKIKLVENNEIAQAFLLRTSDFVEQNLTNCALLVTSKVLHNGESDVFRNYLFTHTNVEKTIDFSAISEHLFKQKKSGSSTLGPAAFLVFKWSNEKENSLIKHYAPKLNRFFNAFNVIVIESFDNKNIKQSIVIENDWAWKVFLYGSILDFRFISYLKRNYKTIKEIIDNPRFVFGRGIEPKGTTDKDTAHLKQGILIDANKDIDRYHIQVSEDTVWKIGRGKEKRIWDRKTAHRAKRDLFELGLFDGNSLLVTKGLNSNYYSVCAFMDKKAFFRDALTAIKAKFKKDTPILKNIIGFLNSTFFSYFVFSIGSSTGIERKQVHINEKFSLPIVQNDGIPKLVDKISKLNSQIHKIKASSMNAIMSEKLEADSQITNLENQANEFENQIEKAIHNSFNFSNEEKALIDFSQQISIPLFKGEDKPFQKVGEKQLKKYTSIFKKFLNEVFNFSDKFFEIEAYESPYMIGVKFNIVSKKPQTNFNYSKDKEQKQILEMLSVIAFEQITDRVFIQKDVKVVNKNSFWIIKPNEFKCWHEAVAYLDLEEFIPKLIKPLSNKSK